MIETTKYVRKPLYVDAVKVTEENFDELADWCHGTICETSNRRYIRVRVHNPKTPLQSKAFVGNWILYTERGYKIYTEEAFANNFQLAEKKKWLSDTEVSEIIH